MLAEVEDLCRMAKNPSGTLHRRLASLCTSGVLFAALLLSPAVAEADARIVTVENGFFRPAVLRAEGGATVVWNEISSHNVVAHIGSDLSSVGQFAGPFAAGFKGGSVWYRCTYHSYLNSHGTCTGMCGVITDATTEPPVPPTIDSPSSHQPTGVNPVIVGGTSEPGSEVRIFEGNSLIGSAVTQDDGRWRASIKWERGLHEITARAKRPEGVLSNQSAPHTIDAQFKVTDDAPPWLDLWFDQRLLCQSCDAYFTSSTQTLKGRVGDPKNGTEPGAAASVRLWVFDEATQRVTRHMAMCAQCPSALAYWQKTLKLAPGQYQMMAEAEDTSGRNYFSYLQTFWVLST